MSDHQIMFNNKCPDKVCKASIAKSKKELKRIEWTEVESISKTDKDQKSQASIQ